MSGHVVAGRLLNSKTSVAKSRGLLCCSFVLVSWFPKYSCIFTYRRQGADYRPIWNWKPRIIIFRLHLHSTLSPYGEGCLNMLPYEERQEIVVQIRLITFSGWLVWRAVQVCEMICQSQPPAQLRVGGRPQWLVRGQQSPTSLSPRTSRPDQRHHSKAKWKPINILRMDDSIIFIFWIYFTDGKIVLILSYTAGGRYYIWSVGIPRDSCHLPHKLSQ